MRKWRLGNRCLTCIGTLGIAFALLAAWLVSPSVVKADPAVHCVNLSGSGCGGDCGNCYTSVQAAVNAASAGHEIRIANGTYAPGGTVASIQKSLTLRGGYNQDFSTFDPDMYLTTLDAGWNGSVISATNVSNLRLEHLTLTHGDGTDNITAGLGGGGGIYALNTTLYVDWCEITDNRGSSTQGAWGGGIYVNNQANGLMTNIAHSRIISNTASTYTDDCGNGGGIYIFYGELSLTDSQVVDNEASPDPDSMPEGGGLYLSYVSLANIQGNVIQNNRSSDRQYGSGGGIYMIYSNNVTISHNQILDNRAQMWAGGVHADYSDVWLDSNTILGNSAIGASGIYLRTTTPVTLSNNLIAENHVSGNYGAVMIDGLYNSTGEALLVNNTIANNNFAGVSTISETYPTLINNLIVYNTYGIYAEHPGSMSLSADTNLFWNTFDPYTGTNAIQQEPQVWEDFRLRPGSPAVDQGVNIAWLTVDIEGRPRPWDAYDLGAYEGVRWSNYLPLVLHSP